MTSYWKIVCFISLLLLIILDELWDLILDLFALGFIFTFMKEPLGEEGLGLNSNFYFLADPYFLFLDLNIAAIRLPLCWFLLFTSNDFDCFFWVRDFDFFSFLFCRFKNSDFLYLIYFLFLLPILSKLDFKTFFEVKTDEFWIWFFDFWMALLPFFSLLYLDRRSNEECIKFLLFWPLLLKLKVLYEYSLNNFLLFLLRLNILRYMNR